jgi:acyl-CoA thioester hydrolase
VEKQGMALAMESNIVARYAETDKMGVVYYANYLVWMEVGRTDYLASLGFPYSQLEDEGVLFPVSAARIKLHRPSYYEDKLVVSTVIESLRSRKVEFSYRITRDGELLVEGGTEHICVDGKMKVRKIPAPLCEALRQSFNGGN